MKYRCLRNCYVNDRFHYQGETYELPDDMVKSEKNFSPVVVAPAPKTRPEVIPPGFFWCERHNTLHKETSKTGKKCLKNKVKPEPEPKPVAKEDDGFGHNE